jgi:hypothetical protein
MYVSTKNLEFFSPRSFLSNLDEFCVFEGYTDFSKIHPIYLTLCVKLYVIHSISIMVEDVRVE